jgi:hypothetical protein
MNPAIAKAAAPPTAPQQAGFTSGGIFMMWTFGVGEKISAQRLS